MKLPRDKTILYAVAILTLGAIAITLILTNQTDIGGGLLELIIAIIGGIAGYGVRRTREA